MTTTLLIYGLMTVIPGLLLLLMAIFGGDTDIDWSAVAKSNPRGRVGTPEDIAGLTIFLCSRAGAFVVGETIACDGGSAYAT